MTVSRSIKFHFVVEPKKPTYISVPYSDLRMISMQREHLGLVKNDEEWNVQGVYILIGQGEDGNSTQVYVGEVGKRTLPMRIAEHNKEKPWWSHAILVHSPHWHSASIGWLEGQLYDICSGFNDIEIMNGNRPSDNTLPQDEQSNIKITHIPKIQAILQVYGVDTVRRKSRKPTATKGSLSKESSTTSQQQKKAFPVAFKKSKSKKTTRRKSKKPKKNPAILARLANNGLLSHGETLWLLPEHLFVFTNGLSEERSSIKEQISPNDSRLSFVVDIQDHIPRLKYQPSTEHEPIIIAASQALHTVEVLLSPNGVHRASATSVADKFSIDPGGQSLEELLRELEE